jgi:UDP-N-acetylglucosamine pyrophosphorylase
MENRKIYEMFMWLFCIFINFIIKSDIFVSNQSNEGSSNEYNRHQPYDPVHNYDNTRVHAYSTDYISLKKLKIVLNLIVNNNKNTTQN